MQRNALLTVAGDTHMPNSLSVLRMVQMATIEIHSTSAWINPCQRHPFTNGEPGPVDFT